MDMNNYENNIVKMNKKHKRRQIWLRILSGLMCITVFITTYALILPAVTLDTSDPTVSHINFGNISWNDEEDVFENISLVLSIAKDTTYTLQTSTDNGATWAAVSGYPTPAPNVVNTGYTLFPQSAAMDEMFQNAGLTTRFRIYCKGKKSSSNTVSFGFVDLLEAVKPHFREWLSGDYLEMPDASTPATKEDYILAFDIYYHVPVAEVSLSAQTSENDSVTATAVVKDMNDNVLNASDYHYQWQYYDESDPADAAWVDIDDETGATYTVSPENQEPIPYGGAQVRCVITNASDDTFVTRSASQYLNPQKYFFEQNASTIETVLTLSSVPLNKGTLDLTFNSNQWNWLYFDAVARDPKVPFNDADTFKNYLCKVYFETLYAAQDGMITEEGKTPEQIAAEKLRNTWFYYRYDLIDPGSQNTNYGTYYTTGGFGDKNLAWVKTNDNDDSFHYVINNNPANPEDRMILPLTYDYLDGGVDYDNFIDEMSKYATADVAGDGNSERKYNVDMITDARAQVKAPIVIVFQIQTSWQLFDLEHANALAGQGGTEVGAVAENSELATFYDIKHAMLDLTEYMEKKYPGNNLVIGVTEVRHGGSDSMFYTTMTTESGSTAPLYVSNNPRILYDAISQWDIFGNCEHVHYDNNTLKLAVQNLGVDLSDFRDKNNNKISYDDIRKAVIIIGGPTENSGSENGYNCVLPWSSFASADIDSVYGIRVNKGKTLAGNTNNGTPILSWLDIDENNAGVYKDGNGANGFTEKLVCTTREQLFNAFVDIVEKEFDVGGIDILDVNSKIDDMAMKDTVRNEFQMDYSDPFVINIAPDLNGARSFSVSVDLQTMTAFNANGEAVGTVTKTVTGNTDTYSINYTVDPGDTPHPTQIVISHNDNGTTGVEVDFNRLYNTQKAEVNFGIQAKEGYIGSNNVFTNVGVPVTTYTHQVLSGDVIPYEVKGKDNPQVNVPIEFSVGTGSHKVLFRESDSSVTYDISLNNANNIPREVQGLVDDFGQINGTLSYTWILPDGSEVEIGGVEIRDGKPQGGFPNISRNYEFTENGFFYGQLNVTFTPEDTDPQGEFHDTKTATAVFEKDRAGIVTFQIVSPDTKDLLNARKTWVGNETHPSAITFKLVYEDSQGIKQYYKENGVVREFILSADSTPDPWAQTYEIVPIPDGNGSVVEYTAVEAQVDGYSSSITFGVERLNEYEAFINAFFTPQIANNGSKVVIYYTYNGVDYTTELDSAVLNANTTWNDIVADKLPTMSDGTPYPATINKVEYVSGNDVYTVFKNDIDPYDCVVTQVGYPVFTIVTGNNNNDKIDKGKIVRIDYTVGDTTYHIYHKMTAAVEKNRSFTVTGTELLAPGTTITNVAAYWGNDINNQNNAISSAAFNYLGMRKQNVTFKTPIALQENKTVEITLTKVVPAGETAPSYTAEYTVPKNGLPQNSTINFEFPDVLPDGEYYLSDLVYKIDGNTANDRQLTEKTTVTLTTPIALPRNDIVRVTLSDGSQGSYTVPNDIPAGTTVVVEFANNPLSGTTVTAIEHKSGNNYVPLVSMTKVDVTTPIALAKDTTVTVTIHDETANVDITASSKLDPAVAENGTITLTEFKRNNAVVSLDPTHEYSVTGVTYKPKNGVDTTLETPGTVNFTLPYKVKGDGTLEQVNFKGKTVTLTVKDGNTVVQTVTGTIENKDHKSGENLTVIMNGGIIDNEEYTYELQVNFDNNFKPIIDDFSFSCGGTRADAFFDVGGKAPQTALYIGGNLPDNRVTSSGFNTISAAMEITEGVSLDEGEHTVYYENEETGEISSFTVSPVVNGTTATFTNTTAIPAGDYRIINITRPVSGVETPYYNDLNAYLKTDSLLTNITVTSSCDIVNTPIVFLPSTGGQGILPYVITGLCLMAGAIIYGYILRRKREGRYC